MRLRYACALLLFAASPALAETLTNRSIVALSETGLGDQAIIAKIQSSDPNFDLSTDQMIALKKQGVSGPVVAAMIAANDKKGKGANSAARGGAAAPSSPGPARPVAASELNASRPMGVYLLSQGKLVRIDFNVSGQTRTGGLLGMALTGGIAAASMNVTLQGESARTKTSETSPTFYFYLAGSDGTSRAEQNSFTSEANASPSTPNEFSLIRLTKKKGQRQARVGKMNIGGVKAGVMEKERVDFEYDEVRTGIYVVRPTAPLTPGEYGFLMIGGANVKLARMFDFSVQ